MTTVLLGAAAFTAVFTVAVRGAAPADAETVLAANPDVIVLEDFQGAGDGPFTGLLAAVPAVAGGRVHTVPAAIASSTNGTSAPEGPRAVARILHPELF